MRAVIFRRGEFNYKRVVWAGRRVHAHQHAMRGLEIVLKYFEMDMVVIDNIIIVVKKIEVDNIHWFSIVVGKARARRRVHAQCTSMP